ncbi:MAG: nucleotidyltransferase domain-containing protein [Dehalococcoidia bacterium]
MTSAATVNPAIGGDAPWQRAVCAFVEKVLAHYGDRLAAVVLYGSRARGDADEEGSDVDLLVVLRDDFDVGTEHEVPVSLAYDLEEHFEYPLLAPLVATETDYRTRMLPLFMNIRREGVELWSAGRPTRVREERPRYEDTQKDDLELVLRRAHEALEGARIGLNEKLSGWAANRAYYAMFHAATALLLS